MILYSCHPVKTDRNKIDYRGFTENTIVLAGYSKNEFKQDDTLGTISIKTPDRLDTFYQWTHFSDCVSCGNVKYRFADKMYKQFKENGLYWTYKPDSVYQLSIWHNLIKEAPDSINIRSLGVNDTGYTIWFENNLYCKKYNYFFRSFKVINNRAFLISGFSTPCGYLTNSESIYLTATTNLKKRHLYFIAECSAKDTAGFFENIYKAILSIRISER